MSLPVLALDLVDSIPGWLRPEDADKLHELARSTPGPILDIGTYHGKSVVLMALATTDRKRDVVLYTLDVDLGVLRAAKGEAQARGVADRIVFVRATLAGFVRAYPQLRPALTFIDGDHTRAGTTRDLAALEEIVPVGGKLLFHDFNDSRNDDSHSEEVRVRPAVEASWVGRQCDFDGVFGCCGLFTRRHGGPFRDIPIADLLRLDSPRDQYLHRLQYPAGRIWKRIRGRLSTESV